MNQDIQSTAGTNARAAVVNRTHRIVRQRATAIQQQKKLSRGLWVPLGICSVLMAMVCYAVWMVMESSEPAVTEPQLSSEPGGMSSLLMMWMLPVAIAVFAGFWIRRSQNEASR